MRFSEARMDKKALGVARQRVSICREYYEGHNGRLGFLLITQLEHYSDALSRAGEIKNAKNVSNVAKRLRRRHGARSGKKVSSMYEALFGTATVPGERATGDLDIDEPSDDESNHKFGKISISIGSFGGGSGGGGGGGSMGS